MIFYFTGTGNSLQAAKNIAKYNDEKLIPIAKIMNNKDSFLDYNLTEGESIGFVFPIYSWGPPKMVLDFIKRLKLINYKGNYIYTVVTCGANIGNTMKVIKSALRKKNLALDSGFSIVMPNNYVIIGDVENKNAQEKKLAEAEETLKNINEIIMKKTKGVFKVNKGFVPFILTGVINPLFNKGAVDTKKFYVNDTCTGCGICEEVCNCNTIIVNKKPNWGSECSQCLACLHLCPVNAIQYGKGTVKKGRYKNPNIAVNELIKFKK
ncbi:EFR1 family ferrodoxin [Candidatus Clostridium stratigraminis]|uniref:EFR1 family ferrodoxin n=1 Tax=Candidatus Clostridium stratigraminis TaxID=3381661 RepID=A0ABW8T2F9_9CLOT